MIKTDLVLEAHEILLQTSELPELEGVQTEYQSLEGIDISVTNILTPTAAEKIGKAPGRYITIEAAGLREKNDELEKRLIEVLGRELQKLMNINNDTTVLVVGLGNWNVTPDSLGPSVVEKIYVTRHLKAMYPDKIGPGFRNVCAIAPGVLGLTGIESGDIIFGIVQRLKPDIVIAIDALAARSMRRLNTTIQISDTGIYPGSGVGNKRQGITRESLGVPVIAVGVPTVVDAATLTSDVLDLLIHAVQKEAKIASNLSKMLSALDNFAQEDKEKLIKEVLTPEVGVLMVTPKEVDRLLEDISDLLANGLNAALHPRVAEEYLH
ncbi:MAG: GPR endopeptidase [Eubacteriales bacterium]|nr:GPR endopeptidase [Eubacteriales bacterium]MDD3073066.1 GPR endopeptidase [Eubacteriales bacterium]MDD4078115.1 GPR endopeptidase [Eubacteriales bacterium]MDD4768256.1 GPR endopeptidase [Eubacteriales bacterium]